MIEVLAGLAALLVACSLISVIGATLAVRRFARRLALPPGSRPPITVMRPLCGDEPLLEQALASICQQNYPMFQVVFGVQDPHDSALGAVRRVQDRFPGCDIIVVVDSTLHGPNRKVSNLLNMMPAVRHATLVFSDSDLHVQPDYLSHVAAALDVPGTGLVTTVCTGLPTAQGWSARLGATGISHCFLPGAVLSRVLGREDCLGTTMALTAQTLRRVGGLEALMHYLADDHVLAKRVHALGLRVGLAGTVPLTAVPEASLRALWQHEMRWARTIRALEPVLFATSVLQFPLFWAAAALVLSGGAGWSAALFLTAWAVRAAAAQAVGRALHGARPIPAVPFTLLPIRDVLSVCQVAWSYGGGRVVWRGHVMRADNGRAVFADVRPHNGGSRQSAGTRAG